MSPVTLLLALCLAGVVGLLGMQLQRLRFAFSFLLRALLSEITGSRIRNWRGLLSRRGEPHDFHLKFLALNL